MIGDLFGFGDDREMAGVQLDHGGVHALGHESFEVGVMVRSFLDTAQERLLAGRTLPVRSQPVLG
jgi:hypothetical protein